MEAPEKIYLTSDENNSYIFTQKRSDNKGVEYTRTDAFIEKACKFLSNEANIPLWEDYNTFGCDTTKLIDNFKNYMKRE